MRLGQVILTAASFDPVLWSQVAQAIAVEGRGKHNQCVPQIEMVRLALHDRLSVLLCCCVWLQVHCPKRPCVTMDRRVILCPEHQHISGPTVRIRNGVWLWLNKGFSHDNCVTDGGADKKLLVKTRFSPLRA